MDAIGKIHCIPNIKNANTDNDFVKQQPKDTGCGFIHDILLHTSDFGFSVSLDSLCFRLVGLVSNFAPTECLFSPDEMAE